MNDLRFALRQLRKAPGFTFIAVITLALGIGANTAIFSVINAVLLRPLPYPRADRIVTLKEASAGTEFYLSLPDYLDWRHDNIVFEQLAISRTGEQSLALSGRDPEQIVTAAVTANFFKVIGLQPQRGRTFTEDEDKPGAPPLAVISDRLWQRIFARDPNVIGREINLDGVLRTVIGVMPPEMTSPGQADIWSSVMRNANAWQNRAIHPMLLGWGRLKDGVSLERAQAEMKAIAARLDKEHHDTNADVTASITPLLDMLIGSYRANLTLLLAAVGLVLLIACANVANLFATRVAARERDFAIRTAIGASQRQIIRQVLIESLLISTLGGIAGFVVAAWSRDLLVAFAPHAAPRFDEITFDTPVLLFTFALTTLASVFAGLVPAWQSSRADVGLALKAGARGSSETRSARRTRDWFVVAEIALTLVLLSCAGLVLKSFSRLQSVSLGYEPRDLLSARINLPFKRYPDQQKVMNFGRALMDKVRTLPGVENVALASNPPLLAGWQIGFYRTERPVPLPSQQWNAESEVVTSDYFATMKVPILRGRALNERDTANSPLAVVIDQRLAQEYFPGEDPIGKQITSDPDGDGNENRAFQIVGIAAGSKLYGAQEAVTFPAIYFSLQQVKRQQVVLLVRTRANPTALERPIRHAVSSIDPLQPLFDVKVMTERVAETWATQRLLSFLLSLFAGVALLLATIGLYGVIAFTTLRRLREIGVRLALGAQRADIRALILQQGVRLLALGVTIGLVGAIASSHLIRSLLFAVPSFDVSIYFAVCLVLAAAAFLACWLPARRASRVDPIITLRAE